MLPPWRPLTAVSLYNRNLGDLNIGAVTVAGMTVEDIVTPADITITARSIIDADVIDAVPIDYDIDGANVTLTATLGSIGSSTGDPLCDGVFNLLEVRASGNLIASAPNGLVALDSSVLGTTTISALSGVLQSNGDVDATGLDVSLTTNLYLIADADRNGTGDFDDRLSAVCRRRPAAAGSRYFLGRSASLAGRSDSICVGYRREYSGFGFALERCSTSIGCSVWWQFDGYSHGQCSDCRIWTVTT